MTRNSQFQAIFTGADDRGRTGTGITSHGILSPGRLPVPPHRHTTFTTREIISHAFRKVKTNLPQPQKIQHFTPQKRLIYVTAY